MTYFLLIHALSEVRLISFSDSLDNMKNFALLGYFVGFTAFWTTFNHSLLYHLTENSFPFLLFSFSVLLTE